LEACFSDRLDPKLFELNNSADKNRSSEVRDLSSAGTCSPFVRVVAMYLGFVVANPDWYEIEEYDGTATNNGGLML
jgi:hypothetical protein